MNIFYIDSCPTKAAQMQCDRHVVKMILESAQLLSTAHRELDGDSWADANSLYKKTHTNHPSAVWVRQSTNHYHWLDNHFVALCDEYSYRYGKTHLTDTKFRGVIYESPDNCPVNGWVDPPQCMPDQYKDDDTVTAYRNYYRLDKSVNDWFCYNKSRSHPSFLTGATTDG